MLGFKLNDVSQMGPSTHIPLQNANTINEETIMYGSYKSLYSIC